MTALGQQGSHSGGGLLDLLEAQDLWLRRRIEVVSFDDDRTVRRASTLDISLDQYAQVTRGPIPRVGGRALLPIGMQPRTPSRDVTVTTASGEPLPFLTRAEERAMLAAALADDSYGLLQGDSGTKWDAIPGDVRRQRLLRLIESELDLARLPAEWQSGANAALLQEFVEELKPYWADLANNRVVIALPLMNELQTGFLWWRRHNRLRLIESHPEEIPRGPTARIPPLFRIPLAVYWWNAGGTRRTVISPRTGRTTEPPPGHEPAWVKRSYLDDVPVTIPAAQLGESQSYHFELRCPPGMYVHYGCLIVTRFVADDTSDPPTDDGPPDASNVETVPPEEAFEVEVIEIEDNDPHWDTAHFYYTSSLSQLGNDNPATIAESSVVVVLRPMFHGALRTGVNVSALTAVLLTCLTLTLGWSAAGWAFVIEAPFQERQTDALVSLLLLAPTIALALLVRQDEHLFTKFVLNAYRQRVGALAASTFAVAVAFAVGLTGLWLFVLLAISTSIGWIVAAMNWISGRRSRRALASPA